MIGRAYTCELTHFLLNLFNRGKGRSCVYEDLQGATEYEIRLRYKVGDSYGPYSDSAIFKSPTEPNTGFDLHKAIESENIDTLNALLEKR